MRRSRNAKIKIMLSSRPKMLSEVIKGIVGHQPDMEVIGEVINPIDLLSAVREMPVDVVIITPLNAVGDPRICSHLLNENPCLKVVTLSAKGEVAYIFQAGAPRIRFDDPSGQVILGAIRENHPAH